MGRPQKQTAEYFPHFTESGKTMFILEEKWGNDGYTFWYKLMELLSMQSGHYYDCSADESKIYLTAVTRLQERTVDEIIQTLVKLGDLDKDLWEQHKIIWCQELVDSLEPLYKKRTVSVPKKPVFDAETPAEQPAEDVKEPEKEPAKKGRKKKKDEPGKIRYAEFVTMTQEEHDNLVERFGEQGAKRAIEILDNYKGSSGRTYKSDYRAILGWVSERMAEESRNGGRYGNHGAGGQSGSHGGFVPSDGFSNS